MNALPRLQPGCSRAATLPMQAVRRALPSRPARASSVRAAGAADLPPPGPVAAALKAVQLRQPGSPRGKHEDVWSLEDAAEMGATCSNSEKELARRYMRSLSTFNFQRWAFHRSTDRYTRHMLGIFQSRIVRGLAAPLLSAGATATLVCLYEEALRQGALPAQLPSLILAPLPFDITSFALSLLLVFRTNSSYERWQQALAAWGAITTRGRDTMRQLLCYTAAAPEAGPASTKLLTVAATGRWLVAFARALKAQLTEDSDLRAELEGILTPTELDLLCSSYQPTSFALSVLTELVAAAALPDSQRVRVDENLTACEDAMSACERILRTPIPLSYTRHTSRFMVIWLSCLPLGLWPVVGWGTVPLTVAIAFLLLGIEEIGVAVEEPFSILPLDDLCREMEISLSDIVEQAASSKRAAKEAVSIAAAAAVTAAAAEAAAAAAAANGTGAAAGSASSSGDDGSEGARQPAAAPAPATANAVAPLLPGALGRASLSRDLVPAADRLSADAIFNSLDDGDY